MFLKKTSTNFSLCVHILFFFCYFTCNISMQADNLDALNPYFSIQKRAIDVAMLPFCTFTCIVWTRTTATDASTIQWKHLRIACAVCLYFRTITIIFVKNCPGQQLVPFAFILL